MTTRRMIGGIILGSLLNLATRGAVGAPQSLRTDITIAAQWISAALLRSGYNADFTPSSISEVERFFREQTTNGEPTPGGLLAQNLGQRLFALGSYCGEVLRQELGGDWITNDNDPEGEINATLKLAGGAICWPMQRVMKRLRSSEENLVDWAEAIRRA